MAELLIVDDDRNLRETLRELLQGAGYTTRAAANGQEAFTLLQYGTPDVTLCDWKMPGIGGEQFLKSLQSEGRLSVHACHHHDCAWNWTECSARHAIGRI